MTDREKLIELIEQAYYCSIEELADHLISNGVVVRGFKGVEIDQFKEWIPVTERLPEDGGVVLCYMEYNEMRIAQWDESENCWAGHIIDYQKEQVTHWMPLPEPPADMRGRENG